MYRVRVVIHDGWPKKAKWLWVEVLRVYAGCLMEIAGKNVLEDQFSAMAAALDHPVVTPSKLVDCDVVAVLHQRLFAEENREGRERKVFEQALRKIGQGGTVDHWYFTPGIDDSKVAWRFIHRPRPERDGGNDVTANMVKPGGGDAPASDIRRMGNGGGREKRNRYQSGTTVTAKSRTSTTNTKGARGYGRGSGN